ncbi:TolB family protein [Luteibacter sp. CQ10]|uniref:TolB family protein n=1 Tax=Luteibacter sp. CQ10 TaxID=2805821 RepID=UPI0034A37224
MKQHLPAAWLGLLLAGRLAVAADVTPPHLERASVASNGDQGDLFSVRPELPGDGSEVAFISMASNLAKGVSMPGMSIYLRDPRAHVTRLVSATSTGIRANAASVDPAFSGDGRFVVFASSATNLVSQSTFGHKQVYRKNLQSGAVDIVSLDTDGEAGGLDSANPVVSADGSRIVFVSFSSLAPGCRVGMPNVYLRDIPHATTTCMSTGFDGQLANGPSQQPTISGNGARVAFSSSASNLVALDGNHTDDVFVRDVANGTTIRASTGEHGEEGNGPSIEPSLSTDGMRLVFSSSASNLVGGVGAGQQRVYLRDFRSGSMSLAGPEGAHLADAWSGQPRISADGRVVVFLSAATNLDRLATNGKRNIYRWYVGDRSIHRVSIPQGGGELDGDCFQPAISADGSVVAFRSNATNLVTGDSNLTDDVFVEVR